MRRFVFATALLMSQLFSDSHAQSFQWVTGYVTDWDSPRMPVSEIDWGGLTHFVHMNIDPDVHPPYYAFPHGQSVFEQGCYGNCGGTYQRDLIAAAHANNVQALICLGGVGGPGLAGWEYLTADSARCQLGVNNMLAYARSKGYDGVDIDWEEPNASQRNMFALLIRILRRGLDSWTPRGILTVAVGREYGAGFDIATLNAHVDQVNTMSYDCNGWWSSSAGFHTPLYNPTRNWQNYPAESGALNTSEKLPTWISAGLNPAKIGMGLAFYGYNYDNITLPGQHGANFWFFRHYQIVNDYLSRGIGTRGYDTLAHQPYLSVSTTSPQHFINYDDEVSLPVKMNWARNRGIGGLMIFDLNSAYNPSKPAGERHPLLRAVRNALNNPNAPTGTITASRDSLPPGGGNVTLTWTSINATSASIDQGIGSVALNGSVSVAIGQTKTFTLTLINSFGSRTYFARVVVGLPGGGGSPQDITAAGTPIAFITNPSGTGNHNLEVIRDGITPPAGSTNAQEQYDTYNGGGTRSLDWIGYQFTSSQTFGSVVFQEGIHAANGGWFSSAPRVQLRIGGQWIDAQGITITPTYAGQSGQHYATYTLRFNATAADGIRVAGTPGGSANFISCGELRVFTAGTASVSDGTAPADFTLEQNYPNPFNPTTLIRFSVPVTSRVRISIYNLLGQRVRDLVDESFANGVQEVSWDGRDNTGRLLSSGTYIYRMQSGNFVETRKMVLMK